MLKKTVILLLTLWIGQIVNAQTTDFVLRIDSAINIEDFNFNYLDGLDVLYLDDDIKDRQLILSKPFYGAYGSIQITQRSRSNSFVLFINEKPAVVDLKKDDLQGGEVHCVFNENVISVNDAKTNPILKELDETLLVDKQRLIGLIDSHRSELRTNDSISHLHSLYIKQIIESMSPIIGRYADNYYAFYYYKSQMRYAQMYIKDEPDFFEKQLAYMYDTFPPKYLETEEGKGFVQTLKTSIQPIGVGILAPDFDFIDYKGNRLRLADFKGKYVLLDFWATWCPPCMAQIPALKEIRDTFPIERLEIIGVSLDNDPAAFYTTVRDKMMGWRHLWDEKKDCTRLYGVSAYPTIILIDPKGKIVLRKTGGGLSTETLNEMML